MKKISQFYLLIVVLSTIAVIGCKKKNDDNQPQLSHSYAGTIYFEYTKGFPQFSVTIPMDVTVNKDRSVTFGNGGSQNFDEEDIHYEGITPVTKIRITGTVIFKSAKGEYKEINSTEYLWIWVNSSITGKMTVWAWDEELGWIQVMDTQFTYEDSYSDGQMEFKIDDAVWQGSSIKQTLPDIQGTFTYGYSLFLTVIQ